MIPYHKPFPLAEWERVLISQRLMECLENGQLTNGHYVNLLEQKIKEWYDVDYVIVVSSATLGLYLCYSYLPRNIVNIPTFTWNSVVNAVQMAGKTPVYVDIDKDTWLMEDVKGDRGIINGIESPNHTFGNVMESQEDLAIYDGAHSLGCKLNNIGLATVLSLAPTKLVTACEGGVILTNSKGLMDYACKVRRYISRESEPHAIVGLQTLTHLKECLDWKKKVFEYYSKTIPGKFQEVPIESNYNTIGFLNTEQLIIPSEIETKQYYEPLKRGLDNTEYVYSKMICLPSYYNCPYKYIVKRIREVNHV